MTRRSREESAEQGGEDGSQRTAVGAGEGDGGYDERAADPPERTTPRVLRGPQPQQSADEVVGRQVGVAEGERGPDSVPRVLTGQDADVREHSDDHDSSPAGDADRPGAGDAAQQRGITADVGDPYAPGQQERILDQGEQAAADG